MNRSRIIQPDQVPEELTELVKILVAIVSN